jgi:hypothetical protein
MQTLTTEQAILQLQSLDAKLQLQAEAVGRKRSWRHSEKVMTVSSLRAQQEALRMAVKALGGT